MNQQPGPSEYMAMGFKAIRLRGYNAKFNEQRDYKTAKQPVMKKFTGPNFKGLSVAEIDEAEKEGFWTGWLVPLGIIVIDSEDPGVLSIIEYLIASENKLPRIQLTNRGRQYVFRYSGSDIPASSEYICAGGYPVTPPCFGKKLCDNAAHKWSNLETVDIA